MNKRGDFFELKKNKNKAFTVSRKVMRFSYTSFDLLKSLIQNQSMQKSESNYVWVSLKTIFETCSK